MDLNKNIFLKHLGLKERTPMINSKSGKGRPLADCRWDVVGS